MVLQHGFNVMHLNAKDIEWMGEQRVLQVMVADRQLIYQLKLKSDQIAAKSKLFTKVPK
jgi:hypothetical protein